MKRNDRVLFGLLFVVPVLLVIPVALIGSTVWTAGTIECEIVDKTDGTTIGVTLPAGLVPIAVRLAPDVVIDDVRCELGDDARQAIEVARVALQELARTPDCVLVDVRTDCELILVEKVKGKIRVHVDTPDERIEATVPLPVVSSVLAAI